MLLRALYVALVLALGASLAACVWALQTGQTVLAAGLTCALLLVLVASVATGLAALQADERR